MKEFFSLIALLALSSSAFSQTFKNSQGANDPVKLQVIATEDYGPNVAYTYQSVYKEGTELVAYAPKLKLFVLYKNNDGSATYQVFSKNGSMLAQHNMDANSYLRLVSIMNEAKQSMSGGSYSDNLDREIYSKYGRFFRTLKCPVTIEIARSNFKISKVSPSCDDLE